tara:strand:- start:204 stop:488 length:285 start_codon:yes stop_codon:yes gene_type:complete
MDNREKYMREAFDKMQQSKAGMANMTKDQLEAITQTIGALGEALDYCTEVFDLRISDVDRLRTALYKLNSQFDPEPNEYQAEAFAEYGLTAEND